MKAVVFDMDGVLFDTERLCMDSWIEIARCQGITGMEEVFPLCIGLNHNDTKMLVLKHYGKDFPFEEFTKEASAWFRAYVDEKGLPVKEGVRDILVYLKENGWKVGLASSTRYKSIVAHLERTGLSEYFSAIVAGDMVEHSKPQPDIYLMACKELGVEAAQTYAIEDSPNGIRAAYRAGMKPLMVPDMLVPDEEMKELSYRIFEDLVQVQEFLAQKI